MATTRSDSWREWCPHGLEVTHQDCNWCLAGCESHETTACTCELCEADRRYGEAFLAGYRKSQEQDMSKPTDTEPTDTELLRGAVMNAGRHSAVIGPRWWHVAELLGIGSRSAAKLCWRFDQHADEQLGPRLDCEEGCSCECHKD